ncbi:hypothetical protein ACQR16_02730 [Bradyrhizobium oligotrophicum]|uniref:hypothetical protein n=1 Tax=Bradyrhizobium oligotrophicum TaxID=44255 RepID=UPI003EC08728
MRKLVIAAGPSEEPFRVMLPSDDSAAAADQRGGRSRAGRPTKRVGGRAERSPRRLRWARPSRAVAALLAGLKATLSALVPVESPMRPSKRAGIASPAAPSAPRLRLVADCGQALEARAASAVETHAMFHDEPTPRHHVRSRRTARAKRRRLRWR